MLVCNDGNLLCCTCDAAVARSFINRDDLDFASIAQLPPTQEWDLQEVNTAGLLEYPTQ